MDAAHTGLYVFHPGPDTPEDQVVDPVETCASCHPFVAEAGADSLHRTLAGYDTVLHSRIDEADLQPAHIQRIEEMELYHCNDCHATCGECHVSQPNSAGGGLIEGHNFIEQTPMGTCTACHGSRVQNEYYGLNEGPEGRLPRDLHSTMLRYQCTDCHTGNEMHGMGDYQNATHRYDTKGESSCEACHLDDGGVAADTDYFAIPEHLLHGTEMLSCQACHSVAYTNCTNCHVDRADTPEKTPYYTVQEHSLGFFLARNPRQNTQRPYRYVPVRHVPIDPNSFSYYEDQFGVEFLTDFMNRPTWVYATPHNIQRNTPQTESCESCHTNDSIFLTPDKVPPAELEANLGIIVQSAPELPDGYPDEYQEYLPEPADTGDQGDTGDDAGFWGGDAAGDDASDDAGTDDAGFWGGDAAGDDAGDDAGTDDAGFWGQ
jgi:hypothetical protein